MENGKNHSLQIEYGQGLMATEVGEVTAFNDREIRFITTLGVKTIVCGENLKITSFNKSSGDFRAEGDFVKISYEGKKVPVLKKIFK